MHSSRSVTIQAIIVVRRHGFSGYSSQGYCSALSLRSKRILYKNGLVKEIYEGNMVTRDGRLGFSDLVIPSAAEGSLLHCGNQRVCTKGKRCLGAASHQAMSTLQ